VLEYEGWPRFPCFRELGGNCSYQAAAKRVLRAVVMNLAEENDPARLHMCDERALQSLDRGPRASSIEGRGKRCRAFEHDTGKRMAAALGSPCFLDRLRAAGTRARVLRAKLGGCQHTEQSGKD
jgi:hypothetical protein